MNRLKIILPILCCCLATAVFSQTPRAYEQAAEIAFQSKDYYAALKYYAQVLEMEPKRSDIMVRYADAARLYGAYRDAEQYYETALNAENAPGLRYHTALFGLALVKKGLGKYDEALRLFERYATRPDSDPELAKRANAEIGECEWAMEKITNSDKLIRLEPFDAQFRTGDSEMGVMQMGDTMYFCALQQVPWGDKHVPARPLMQVMMSVNGSTPQVAAFSHNKMHTALPAISPDGQWMIIPYGVYVNETDIQCQLYFAKKENGSWTTPAPLPETVNVPGATLTQPCISKGKDGYFHVYYAGNAPGGQGGMDIWQMRMSATGTFSKPENLTALNTEKDEATPYFDAETESLFFSSNGYQSLGGYDIYKVKKSKNTWQTVKHLPFPLNSSYNDLYYAPTAQQQAVMTSNRIGAAAAGVESCCYELFHVTYLNLNLNIAAYEANSNTPLGEVVYALADGKKAPALKYTASAEPVAFKIDREQMYQVVASKDGYYPDTLLVSSVELEPHKTTLKDKIYLRPLPVDLAVRVFNQFSKEPLNGVNVFLYELSGDQIRDRRFTGTDANESGLSADYKRGYRVIANKDGYLPDTIFISPEEMNLPGIKVIKNLFLTPATLHNILPLSIYFDNDVPLRTASAEIESYALTYQTYQQKQQVFIEAFAKSIPDPAGKQAAEARIRRFFEQDVKGGYLKLEHFAENLDLFLGNGYEVEILVKGFASPLASHEYNLALTQRRIVSVKNYLRTVKGGLYENYILDKKLIISTAPMGESLTAPGVNDSRKHVEYSIYSVEASKERRAEIIEVRLHKIHQ